MFVVTRGRARLLQMPPLSGHEEVGLLSDNTRNPFIACYEPGVWQIKLGRMNAHGVGGMR